MVHLWLAWFRIQMGSPKGMTDKWGWLMGLLLPADQHDFIDWIPVLIIRQLLKHHHLQCIQLGIGTISVCNLKLPYKVIGELCLSKYHLSISCLADLYIASA